MDESFGDLYRYRCTTDKLLMHIKRVEDDGDRVEWPVFLGGRDWLLICRKGPLSTLPDVLAEAQEERRKTASVLRDVEAAIKRIGDRVESGAKRGTKP